jgi:hypothetical protein
MPKLYNALFCTIDLPLKYIFITHNKTHMNAILFILKRKIFVKRSRTNIVQKSSLLTDQMAGICAQNNKSSEDRNLCVVQKQKEEKRKNALRNMMLFSTTEGRGNTLIEQTCMIMSHHQTDREYRKKEKKKEKMCKSCHHLIHCG